MSTRVHEPVAGVVSPPAIPRVRARPLAYAGGIFAIVLAYYAAAKVGQSLSYSASVAAMWPPAGVGIAALYLWGLRWWPGVLLGDLVVNAEQHVTHPEIPVG